MAGVHVRIDSIEHVLRQAGLVVEGEGTPLPIPWLLTTCVLVALLLPIA